MPEDICRRIEVIDGSIIVSPSGPPRHKRIARLIANCLEGAAPTPWQVTTYVDLRISDVPLHNRRPDVLVFAGDPDELPVRPRQVLLAVEIMPKGTMGADHLDKSVEYAVAGIPYYWRIEQGSALAAYIYRLDTTLKSYVPLGTYSAVLKVEAPFPVTLDLDALA